MLLPFENRVLRRRRHGAFLLQETHSLIGLQQALSNMSVSVVATGCLPPFILFTLRDIRSHRPFLLMGS